jgi:hypothetical protein
MSTVVLFTIGMAAVTLWLVLAQVWSALRRARRRAERPGPPVLQGEALFVNRLRGRIVGLDTLLAPPQIDGVVGNAGASVREPFYLCLRQSRADEPGTRQLLEELVAQRSDGRALLVEVLAGPPLSVRARLVRGERSAVVDVEHSPVLRTAIRRHTGRAEPAGR